jgi:hypothetical protein
MGLDWMLERKARPESEARAAPLLVEPDGETAEARAVRHRLLDELQWLSPFEVMGCPIVGVDEEATQLLRKFFEENEEGFAKRHPDVAREDLWRFVLDRARGHYMAELAKEPDGLGGIVGIAAPVHSYRGKMVACLDILPPDVAERAYEDMTSEQMLEYADTLNGWAEEAIQQAADPAEAALMRRHLRGENAESDKHMHEFWVVHTACRWLRFWGSRGFSMWCWS